MLTPDSVIAYWLKCLREKGDAALVFYEDDAVSKFIVSLCEELQSCRAALRAVLEECAGTDCRGEWLEEEDVEGNFAAARACLPESEESAGS